MSETAKTLTTPERMALLKPGESFPIAQYTEYGHPVVVMVEVKAIEPDSLVCMVGSQEVKYCLKTGLLLKGRSTDLRGFDAAVEIKVPYEFPSPIGADTVKKIQERNEARMIRSAMRG